MAKKLIFNAVSGQFDFIEPGTSPFWGDPVQTEGDLPLTDVDGTSRVVLDEDAVYVFDLADQRWHRQVIELGAFGSSPNANGLSLNEVNDGVLDTTDFVLQLQPADASNPGGVSTVAQTFSGNKTFANDVTVQGTLNVANTNTINSTTTEIQDANITVNKGGTQATANAQDSGFTVEMSDATNAQIGYDSTLTSKFKVGEIGSESEILTATLSQTATNKNLKSTTNLLTNASADAFTRETGNQAVVTIPDTALADTFVLEAFSQSLTNKNLKSTTNLLTNASADAFTRETGNQSVTTIPDSTIADDFVLRQFTQSLENKTVDGTSATGNNTVTTDADQVTYERLDASKKNIQATSDEVEAALTDLDDAVGALDATPTNYTPTDATIVADHLSAIDTELGDKVDGPASATDEAIARYDGTTGKIIQNSGVTIDDSDVVSGATQLNVDNLRLDGNTLSSTDVNGDVLISPNGTGDIDAATNTIKNVVDPTNDQDAATKKYVDDNTTFVVGDLDQVSFSIANNQATPANITGVAFANGVTRSAEIHYSVIIDATADLYESGQIQLIQKGASWDIAQGNISGDNSLINFSVTAAGQLQYTSASYAGFVSGTIKCRAITTSV